MEEELGFRMEISRYARSTKLNRLSPAGWDMPYGIQGILKLNHGLRTPYRQSERSRSALTGGS